MFFTSCELCSALFVRFDADCAVHCLSDLMQTVQCTISNSICQILCQMVDCHFIKMKTRQSEAGVIRQGSYCKKYTAMTKICGKTDYQEFQDGVL